MNDVFRKDFLGVAAVGIFSNLATRHQIEKLAKFAQQVANNRVLLLADCDEKGEAGFKELLWPSGDKKYRSKVGLVQYNSMWMFC